MANIVFIGYGSAGDIFPSLAVADCLRRDRHDVQFLCDRWLGLYPRAAGFRTTVVGGAKEKRGLEDARLYSQRFDGLDSRRRHMTQYVLPFLDQNYNAVTNAIRKIRPDLIVNSALGLWGSLAGVELGIPCVTLHLYPDLLNLIDRPDRQRSWRFALPLARWLEHQENRLGITPSTVPVARWGAYGSNVLVVHDPALIKQPLPGVVYTGFPYWDQVMGSLNHDTKNVKEFLRGGSGPAIIACLGSYIGLKETSFWRDIGSLARRSDAKVVLIGLTHDLRQELEGQNILACGYVRMSEVVPSADVVIHHGGIGTMYGVLQAGIPAVVTPYAFDQPFNARILENAGGGVVGKYRKPTEVFTTAIRVANDKPARIRCKNLSKALIDPAEATHNIVEALTRLI